MANSIHEEKIARENHGRKMFQKTVQLLGLNEKPTTHFKKARCTKCEWDGKINECDKNTYGVLECPKCKHWELRPYKDTK